MFPLCCGVQAPIMMFPLCCGVQAPIMMFPLCCGFQAPITLCFQWRTVNGISRYGLNPVGKVLCTQTHINHFTVHTKTRTHMHTLLRSFSLSFFLSFSLTLTHTHTHTNHVFISIEDRWVGLRCETGDSTRECPTVPLSPLWGTQSCYSAAIILHDER